MAKAELWIDPLATLTQTWERRERRCVTARVPLLSTRVTRDAHSDVMDGKLIVLLLAPWTDLGVEAMAACRSQRTRAG